MGWSIGYDSSWHRDIGYGVPATCDYPGCGAPIDRGLSYVCGGEPYGGNYGCGLYFCSGHLEYNPIDPETLRITTWDNLYDSHDEEWDDSDIEEVATCTRCATGEVPFEPTPDTPEWISWKLTDESWAQWRSENPEWVKAYG